MILITSELIRITMYFLYNAIPLELYINIGSSEPSKVTGDILILQKIQYRFFSCDVKLLNYRFILHCIIALHYCIALLHCIFALHFVYYQIHIQ